MLTLAIIGRPNVGKSTFFNRLAGKQLAIVDDTPGITRDWREAEGHIFDQTIRIIDTAGLEEVFDESMEARMRKQTEAAIERADVLLFLIDGRSGMTPLDEHFAGWLRKKKVPIILGVNKCENEEVAQSGIAESYGLGFGEAIPLSAAHGLGIEDLYYALEKYFPDEEAGEDKDNAGVAGMSDDELDALEGQEDFDFSAEAPEEEEKALKLSIVGRPNVGKSTLLNTLVNDDRVMTGPEAGVTRDAIAVEWEYKDRKFRLVDTAGLRKRAKITNKIEKMAVDDTMRAIRLSQVVVLMIDANSPLEKQDLSIGEHIINEGRAIVLALNKWDTVEDKKKVLEDIAYKLDTSLAQIKNLPRVSISALNGKNINRLMDVVLKTYDIWNRRAPTGGLNRWLLSMESQHPAPLVSGRPNRLKYITQIKTRPPTFAVWVSRPKELPDTYRRYIVNGLRRDFDLEGVPVRLLVRTSKNPFKSGSSKSGASKK